MLCFVTLYKAHYLIRDSEEFCGKDKTTNFVLEIHTFFFFFNYGALFSWNTS